MPCSPAMANGTWEMRIRRRIEKEPNDQLSQELPRVLLELHASLKPDGVLFSSSPLGRNEEGWNARRYGVCYDLHTWRRYVSHAGFVELSHYYRPAGLPRETQPWLASVCVGKDSGRFSAARWRWSLDRCGPSVRPHRARKDLSMTISMYKASVPIFVQFLTSLSAWLDKAGGPRRSKEKSMTGR